MVSGVNVHKILTLATEVISKATYARAMSVAKKIPERSKMRTSFLLSKWNSLRANGYKNGREKNKR